MSLSLIVAMDINRTIGRGNKLLWHLPKDLEYVREVTSGHTLVMGRRTFESIGRLLPNRRNIILTHDKNYVAIGCEVAHSVEEVFDLIKVDEQVFIFGGAKVYEVFLPYVTKMYITRLHHIFEGDVFFPDVDFSQWEEVYFKQGETDKRNPYIYSFHVYSKK